MSAQEAASGKVDAVDAFWIICRNGVASVIESMGAKNVPRDMTFAQYFTALDRQRNALGGTAAAAKRLSLNEEEFRALLTAIRRAQMWEELSESGSRPENAVIAALRLIDALNGIKEANPSLTFSTALPDSNSEEGMAGTRTQQQVRALELVIRSLITEAYGSQDRLREHFVALNKVAVEKWTKAADKGDLLSGSMFGELVSMFVNADEYPQHYGKLFKDTPFLQFLDEKRSTLEAFLTDVRSIRNRVAHHKRVTPVQVALLDRYYTEIVEPLQTAFDRGHTRVNPDAFFDANADQLKQYFGQTEAQLKRFGDDIDAFRSDLSQLGAGLRDVKTDTVWLRRKMVWVLAGVAVVGAVGVVTLGTSSRTLLNTVVIKAGVDNIQKTMGNVKQETSSDPRKELQNRGVSWTDQNLRDAIKRNDVDTVNLFMRGGMTWRVFYVNDLLKASNGDAQDVVNVLLQNTRLINPVDGDCRMELNSMVHAEPLPPGTLYDSRKLQPHRLTDAETRYIRGTCAKPEDVQYAHRQLDQARAFHQSQQQAYDREKAAIKSAAQCRRDLLANQAQALVEQASRFNITGPSTYTPWDELLAQVNIQILSGGGLSIARLSPLVDKYCATQADAEPNIDTSDWNMRGWEQVVHSIS
ncbi:hypothetical protein ABH945_003246 [Paraburkholderia sp. GAS333]|uniref:STY4199 family HEPN domain-containing protein n=1 Tax=Paraburkholderia sp. GAS333 TaxID=3156279 RepID=UPI003D198C58